MRPRARGAAAVEMAIVAIPLMLMVVAALEFGRAMVTYNSLVKATRDAARHLSGFDPNTGVDYPMTLATNRVLYGTDAPQASPQIEGLTAAMVRICDRAHNNGCRAGSFGLVSTATGQMALVRVEIVGYVFQPIFPGFHIMGTVTFEPIGTTLRQVL